MIINAAVTMNQLQQKLDTIGNNMANANTAGYKSRQTDFSSLLFQQVNNMSDPANAAGRLTQEGIRVGSGARLGAVDMNHAAGSIKSTDRPLDVALRNPNQFFQMTVNENGVDSTLYTRDGSFYLSPQEGGDGLMLTTADGNTVMGVDGPLAVADGFESIEINSRGELIATRNGQTTVEGQLAVVQVVRPKMLEAAGSNSFRLPDLAGLGFAAADIIQQVGGGQDILETGALEQSNVDISKEMSELILTQRSYQFNARTISMGDQMMGLVNQLRS